MFRARIETGSNRLEIIQNSTSVKEKPERCTNYKLICRKEKKIMSVFQVSLLISNVLVTELCF